MTVLIIIVHVFVCLALILIVLLQTGKGADMGASFGSSGSQTLFGASGAMTFLNKATTIVAVVFMVTCLLLAYISTNQTSSSIMKDEKAPMEQKAVTAETTEQGTPATQVSDTAAPASSETTAPAPTTTPETSK